MAVAKGVYSVAREFNISELPQQFSILDLREASLPTKMLFRKEKLILVNTVSDANNLSSFNDKNAKVLICNDPLSASMIPGIIPLDYRIKIEKTLFFHLKNEIDWNLLCKPTTLFIPNISRISRLCKMTPYGVGLQTLHEIASADSKSIFKKTREFLHDEIQLHEFSKDLPKKKVELIVSMIEFAKKRLNSPLHEQKKDFSHAVIGVNSSGMLGRKIHSKPKKTKHSKRQ